MVQAGIRTGRVVFHSGLLGTVATAFALDLVWPILLLLGVETVRVSPGDTAFTHLAFDAYPWSHSLLTVAGWSVLAGILGRTLFDSRRAGVVLGGLVLSHWGLDFVTHRPDLPLWPGGYLVGLGLWNSIPGTILVEAGLLVAGIAAYRSATSARDRMGTAALIGLVAVTVAIWISQPGVPLPQSVRAVAVGASALWLLPAWATWIERHRRVREGAE